MAVQNIRVEELLEHTDWLRGVARGLVQGDEAEDVTQETMMAALRSPPSSDQPMRPWLSRVAKNVVRMNYRSDTRRKRRELAFSDELAQATRAADVRHRFELQRTVAELMTELPEPFRRTLLYRYFDDQSSTEIAALEGIAAGTVRWRIKRGLEMLRERLDERRGERKAWMLALQPMLELPSNTATAGGSSAAVAAQGAIAMKAGKIAAVTVALAGVSYVGFATSKSESQEHQPNKAVSAQTVDRDIATKSTVVPNSGAVAGPKTTLTRRESLLAALAVAKRKRLARLKEASSKPMSQQSRELALPTGELEKDYIRDQMGEILPLVKECYEVALLRRPDLEGTTIVEFSLIGEEEVGGIVEHSEVDREESSLVDEELSECIQETMYALEFEPPKGGGRIVVRYPFEMRLAEE